MKIAPSILNANFQNLQLDLDSIATADRIHLDIMDGQFVPNLSFGPPVLKNLKYPVETEAHLMVDNPEKFFEMFLNIGVSGITFHIENTGIKHATELLKILKEKGIRAGICVDGYSHPADLSDEILELADQILLMSVKAGFGGQSFMPEVLEKIKNLRQRRFKGEIEVDGGINLDNAKDLQKAGANVVVIGSFLMKIPAKERQKMIMEFQKI